VERINWKKIAEEALHTLRSEWDRGGDMGNPEGVLIRYQGRIYAVRLELWTKECLMDLPHRGSSQARERGQKLADQWKAEGWPQVGYVDVGEEGVFGATWAVDRARDEEIADAHAKNEEIL
jgi:hypothetical protein